MLVVVIGPPCSGKSTYVRERAEPGDVIIDFDVIAQALGSPDPHRHNDAIRHVTIHARRAAIAAALRTHARGHRVWIVDTKPPAERLTTYRAAGAQLIILGDVDKPELHRRAAKERPALWHRLIDEWAPPDVDSAVVLTSRDW